MHKRAPRPTRYIDGLSESAWKSLVVKSLRLGWPEGISQAAARLSRSTMDSLLICGLFEDTFPHPEELAAALTEVRRGRYAALCARETHHGQGLANAFCDLQDEAQRAAKEQARQLVSEAAELHFYLPPRANNCFYTWLRLADQIPLGLRREIDESTWRGMPPAMLDDHTKEGRVAGVTATVLSGHYASHRKLGTLVVTMGWAHIRKVVHDEEPRDHEYQFDLGV